jgi:glycosyltransferase involved in cell wall biosynthesis
VKVSFIIPIYKKKEEELRQCLTSLFDQTHKDIEIICVFDGPDETLQGVAKEFKVDHTLVIEHGGACKARNAGFKVSTGDIISFWDADCYAVPMMVEVWLKYLAKYPQMDFVYSGYKFTDTNMSAFPSCHFNPWTLKKFNYIPSMFPCRRENVVEWDESLTGLQDWDYWRRVADNGARGLFIGGQDVYAVTTEYPTSTSISGQADKRLERITKIREKFNDPNPDILVWGGLYDSEAIKVAKYLDADYFWSNFYKIRDYPLQIIVGFNPDEFVAVVKREEKAKRILYWMGFDASKFVYGPYADVKRWLKIYEELVNVHLCSDEQTRKTLQTLGIEAEVVPLPRDEGESLSSMPSQFKVMCVFDETYEAVIDAVIKAMPDIQFVKFDPNKGANIADYSLFIRLTNNLHMTDPVKNILLNGRHLISNIQAPYAGYLSEKNSPTEYLNEIINRIQEIKDSPVYNQEAKDYYMEECSPNKFKEKIMIYAESKLEVVA